MKLLQKPNYEESPYIKITNEDWKSILRKSSRKSTSSIFSKRNYSMYKCTIESSRITTMLVDYYNIIIKNNFHPTRWLDILDLILEKGKGPLLGKLRIIQLLEADLQLIIRLFAVDRMSDKIEHDNRIAKANYGSRRNYSIENIILEKRLLYDISKQNGKHTIHNMTDLQACYDRQLPQVCSIVQESTGMDRHAVKLVTKTITSFKHHLCTNFGICPQTYGGINDLLAGTGQGNSLSGIHCRDVSCLIVKDIENKNLGMIIKDRINFHKEIRTSLAFVDDTDFYANGKRSENIMNQISDKYTEAHETIGGKIEEGKTRIFS